MYTRILIFYSYHTHDNSYSQKNTVTAPILISPSKKEKFLFREFRSTHLIHKIIKIYEPILYIYSTVRNLLYKMCVNNTSITENYR